MEKSFSISFICCDVHLNETSYSSSFYQSYSSYCIKEICLVGYHAVAISFLLYLITTTLANHDKEIAWLINTVFHVAKHFMPCGHISLSPIFEKKFVAHFPRTFFFPNILPSFRRNIHYKFFFYS
jgi:hypothetical protein